MDDQSWQEVYDFTSSSASNIPTPTSTLSTISEPISANILKDDQDMRPIDLKLAFQNPPIADELFLIRSREKPHLLLTICGGEPKCIPKPIAGGGSFWHCYKKNNWYLFRNTVSGTYLGLDGGKVCAKPLQSNCTQYLTLDRDESGGYILHVLHVQNVHDLSSMERWQVAISEDGRSVVPRGEGGTVWDFIDLKYFQQSSSLVYPGMKPEKLR